MPWERRVSDRYQCPSGYESIFTLSKLFGIFPFHRSGRFRLSKAVFVYSLTIYSIFYYIFFAWDLKKRALRRFHNNTPLVPDSCMLWYCLLGLPLLSPAFLAYKLKSVEDVFAKLDRLYAMTDFRPKVRTKVLYFFIVCLGMFFLTRDCKTSDLPFLIMVFPQIQVFMILDQFATIINVFRRYYIFLSENVNLHNAQLFVRCTEILWDCSSTIMECYTPQLITFMIYAFATSISNIYVIILYFEDISNKSGYASYFMDAFICTAECYYLIYTCSETKIEAVKFDKLLHRMVIEDDTKTLLRNKRITLHFKTIRKEEFSAMGFFNFDYPLFCSMVSSATTYIVIFIQFS